MRSTHQKTSTHGEAFDNVLRGKQFFTENVYQLQETLFDMLHCSDIPYSNDQKLFEKLAIFDFISICVQRDKIPDTKATSWIGKHVAISVVVSSNSIEQPSFLINSNPEQLVESFVDFFDKFTADNKPQMELRVLDIESDLEKKQTQPYSLYTCERRCSKEPVMEYEDGYIDAIFTNTKETTR